MRNRIIKFFLGLFPFLGVSLTQGSPSIASEAFYADTVQPFLDTYCISCHGPDKQKGDRRYDTLTNDFRDSESIILWQDIADLMNLGDMPPEEKSSRAPENANR